jgi:hypothetical protein
MSHYENRMHGDRVYIKDNRGSVIKPRSADVTGQWKTVPTVDSKHWRLSLARKKMALDLAVTKK